MTDSSEFPPFNGFNLPGKDYGMVDNRCHKDLCRQKRCLSRIYHPDKLPKSQTKEEYDKSLDKIQKFNGEMAALSDPGWVRSYKGHHTNDIHSQRLEAGRKSFRDGEFQMVAYLSFLSTPHYNPPSGGNNNAKLILDDEDGFKPGKEVVNTSQSYYVTPSGNALFYCDTRCLKGYLGRLGVCPREDCLVRKFMEGEKAKPASFVRTSHSRSTTTAYSYVNPAVKKSKKAPSKVPIQPQKPSVPQSTPALSTTVPKPPQKASVPISSKPASTKVPKPPQKASVPKSKQASSKAPKPPQKASVPKSKQASSKAPVPAQKPSFPPVSGGGPPQQPGATNMQPPCKAAPPSFVPPYRSSANLRQPGTTQPAPPTFVPSVSGSFFFRQPGAATYHPGFANLQQASQTQPPPPPFSGSVFVQQPGAAAYPPTASAAGDEAIAMEIDEDDAVNRKRKQAFAAPPGPDKALLAQQQACPHCQAWPYGIGCKLHYSPSQQLNISRGTVFGYTKRKTKMGKPVPCQNCISHGYYCAGHKDQDPLERQRKKAEFAQAAHAYAAQYLPATQQHYHLNTIHNTTNNLGAGAGGHFNTTNNNHGVGAGGAVHGYVNTTNNNQGAGGAFHGSVNFH